MLNIFKKLLIIQQKKRSIALHYETISPFFQIIELELILLFFFVSLIFISSEGSCCLQSFFRISLFFNYLNLHYLIVLNEKRRPALHKKLLFFSVWKRMTSVSKKWAVGRKAKVISGFVCLSVCFYNFVTSWNCPGRWLVDFPSAVHFLSPLCSFLFRCFLLYNNCELATLLTTTFAQHNKIYDQIFSIF